MLSILSLTVAFVLDVDVTLLGGSMAQSRNVHEHNERLLVRPNSPAWALAKEPTATEIETSAHAKVRPLPASQRTVRGPHPGRTLLDEIDEMDYGIYSAAMGQAMPTTNRHGLLPEYTVAASTWQNPDGTFMKVKTEFEEKGLPVYTFCYKENLQPHGWMTSEFIERKKQGVPAEMFRVEYELGEPSGDARAFDLNKVEQFSVQMKPLARLSTAKADDTTTVYSKPKPGHQYAVGADWAKSQDFTVITVVDCTEATRPVVYWRRMRRKPYPQMIKDFDDVMKEYNAVGYHDGTGLGNVVHDFVDSMANKFVFIGRDRVQMLLDFITAFENGRYRIPRDTPLYREVKYCPNDAVYRRLEDTSHLPDCVASLALAHRAAEKLPQPEPNMDKAGGVPKLPDDIRKIDKPFHQSAADEEQLVRYGDVTVKTEHRDDVFELWMS